MSKELAEEKLLGMLKAANLPVRPSYRRAEVCAILGVDKRTFWRMVAHHEPDGSGQRKRLPHSRWCH